MRLPRRKRNQSLTIVLWANAALLAAILLAMLSRGSLVGTSAMAAPQMTPPIAGGGGRFLMPAQFSMNNWGCYIMDIDKQTLCAYEFFPSEKELRLVAARDFGADLNLKNFCTRPPPNEIQNLINLEHNSARENPPVQPPGSPEDKGN